MNGSKDFNWVKARSDCSANLEFCRLKKRVKEDTEEKKGNPRSIDRELVYQFEDFGGNEFVVTRDHSHHNLSVNFLLQENFILITGDLDDSKTEMELTLTLNDEGLCRFKIGGDGEYLPWQVSRKALEYLFFL